MIESRSTISWGHDNAFTRCTRPERPPRPLKCWSASASLAVSDTHPAARAISARAFRSLAFADGRGVPKTRSSS